MLHSSLITVVLSCPFVFMKGKMKEIGEFLMSIFIIFYSPKGLEHKDVGIWVFDTVYLLHLCLFSTGTTQYSSLE